MTAKRECKLTPRNLESPISLGSLDNSISLKETANSVVFPVSKARQSHVFQRTNIVCVASVSVGFGSKERTSNGFFGVFPAHHFSRGQKRRKSCSSFFLCSPTPRKRLLRRLGQTFRLVLLVMISVPRLRQLMCPISTVKKGKPLSLVFWQLSENLRLSKFADL